MAVHTICCTCGNILRVVDPAAGAKAVCSRCEKVWTVPDLPDQASPTPPPAGVRRVIVSRRPASSTGSVIFTLAVLGAIGLAVLFLLRAGADKTPTPGPDPVAAAPQPPPAMPPPDPPFRGRRDEGDAIRETVQKKAEDPPRRVMSNRDRQAELDLYIYRINTAGLVAAVLDLRGKKAEAASLRDSMAGFAAELDRFLARVKEEGQDPFVPDHLLRDDVIAFFDTHDFKKLDAAASERVLVRFLAALKAGSRARVAVKRGSDFADLDIRYHQRPKELYVILQLASIVPGAADPSAESGDRPVTAPPPPPEISLPEALKVLADAFRRAPPVDRARAAKSLRDGTARARAPAVVFTGATYLAISDEAWDLKGEGAEALQGYFDAVKIAEVESFDKARHLAALGDLRTRIPAVRAKSPVAEGLLLRFASAHASDSGASVDEVAKAAEGLGLKRTADGKRWGDAVSALRADLAQDAAEGRARDAWKRFDEKLRQHDDFGVRLLGAWLLAIETFDRNQGGYDRLAAGLRFIGKGASREEAEHAEALAASVEAAAKCSKCKSGRIPCPKCGGDGKADVKCPKCDGKGRFEKGGGTVMCSACNGKGVFRNVECGCARTNNQVDCPDCKGKSWFAQILTPNLSLMATLKECPHCRGFGMPPVGVAMTCGVCYGFGKVLVPTADPKKVLR